MQLVNPQQHVGSNVRFRSQGANKHFGRGKLLRIEGKCAIVKPFQRHRQEVRIPLAEVHTWAAGNFERQLMTSDTRGGTPTVALAAETEGPWIVADTTNIRFFVSPWSGFKPELNRAKVYQRLRSANHAASVLRRRPTSDIGTVEVLTVSEAEDLIKQRYHAGDTAAEQEQPQVIQVPEPQPQGLDLVNAAPDQLRAASEILRRMADAEAMHREAALELEKVRREWQSLQEQIAADAQAAQPRPSPGIDPT